MTSAPAVRAWRSPSPPAPSLVSLRSRRRRATGCSRRWSCRPSPRTDQRGRSDLGDVAGVGRERRAAALRVVADLGTLGRRGPGLEGVLTVPEQLGDEVRRAALRVTELEAD